MENGTEMTAERLNAEPLPEWYSTADSWKRAWTTHWAFFALVNFIIALYCVHGIYSSRKRTQRIARNLAYSVHSLMFAFGISRGLFLVLNPYELKPNFDVYIPLCLIRVFHGIGYASLTASFAFIHISFQEAVKGKITDSKLRSVKFLIAVITVHFSVVILSAILTTLVENMLVMHILCHCYFQLMVILIVSTISYSGYKLIQEAKSTHNALSDMSSNYKIQEENSSNVTTRGIRKVRNVIVLTITVCSGMTALVIYALIEIVNLLDGGLPITDEWPFLAYVTAFRLVDIAMAGTVLYAIAPLRKNGGKMRLFAFFREKATNMSSGSGTVNQSMDTAMTSVKEWKGNDLGYSTDF